MSFQIFNKTVGFGPKSYSLINKKGVKNAIIFTGISTDYSKVILRISKILPECKIKHIKIGNERSSNEELNSYVKNIQNDEISLIFAIGGGSIIDYVKQIYLISSDNIKHNLELVVIPSKIGSGAESSIATILNINKKKIISVNDNSLPNGVIYDTELFSKLDNDQILLGAIDAITHCIESKTSILSNHYSDFLAQSSLFHFSLFIKKIDLESEKKFSNDILYKFCMLSFNGGLAQSKTGAGICHALAHAAEEITGLSHSMCVAYFLKPTLKYLSELKQNFFDEFSEEIEIGIFRILDRLNKFYDFTVLDQLVSDTKKLDLLIEKAAHDSCWRLFYKKIDIDLLKNSF
mgnify:CR=1 FL=1